MLRNTREVRWSTKGSERANYILLMHLALLLVWFLAKSERESGNEVQAVEVIFSYPSYNVTKLQVNSLTLSSTPPALTVNANCARPTIKRLIIGFPWVIRGMNTCTN